jgi:hypothetical protein
MLTNEFGALVEEIKQKLLKVNVFIFFKKNTINISKN